MILHCYSFRIFSLDNCVDDTPTETGLTVACYMLLLHATPRLTPGRLPAPSCATLGVAPPGAGDQGRVVQLAVPAPLTALT